VPSTDSAEISARELEDRRDAEAFRLLFYTGLRLGEVLTRGRGRRRVAAPASARSSQA
jgi:hypothetical protein